MIEKLAENKQYLSIKGIDSHLHEVLGMPKTYLQKHIDGSQKMPQKWQDKVNEYLEDKTKEFINNLR